jgi:hypothetical protein
MMENDIRLRLEALERQMVELQAARGRARRRAKPKARVKK